MLTLFEVVDSAQDSNASFGYHDYKHVRDDGTVVTLGFNQHEPDRYISISVRVGGVATSWMHINNCEIIRMLDAHKKQLEILFDYSPRLRCFIDLNGPIIVTMSQPD
ncbi:MAG: hypothetical protein H0X30_02060 [Anaerolineae bacterium]|nr:hypothetical protein [Anaerolineae bacterium]